jgi:hypothetical protein
VDPALAEKGKRCNIFRDNNSNKARPPSRGILRTPLVPMPFPCRSVVVALAVGLLAPLPARAEEASSGDTLRAPEFRADAAWELLLRQVAFGPRVPGTPGHAAQLAWMRSHLAERADTVEVQAFSHRTRGGEILALRNVFARFRPELRDRLLLVAHWDTRPRSDEAPRRTDRALPVPGANDGASGVAVLLEMADLLRRAPPPLGVDLLLVDGEDFGPGDRDMYLGSRFFAANLPAGYAPRYGIVLDMVGDRDPRFPVERHSARLAPEVVGQIWGLAHQMGWSELFPYARGPALTDDHLPLNRAGIPTVLIVDFDYGPRNRFWHTQEDVPENTSARTLGIVGALIAELIRRGG